MEAKKILIVDDNKELRETLGEYLEKAGFEVHLAEDGEAMWPMYHTVDPNLIILDIMMPGEDGFSLCRELRRLSDVPIIMLTAVTEEADRVAGLEMGADDYITKSFSPRELLARVKTILRRTQSAQARPSSEQVIGFGQWKLDTYTRQLSKRGSETSTALSGSDLSLLRLFLKSPKSLLTRDQIAQTIWGRDALPMERGIDVQVSRLRNHLQDSGRELIVTVRNQGYILMADIHNEK